MLYFDSAQHSASICLVTSASLSPPLRRIELSRNIKQVFGSGLKDQNNAIFYDKLTFLYIEMPNFKKTEKELSDRKEKWLYFLKNLEDLDHIPSILGEEVFTTAFKKAELSKLDAADMAKYEESLKVYRDLHNVIDTARFEGFEEGKLEGKLEIARALMAEGMSISKIVHITGLSEQVIKSL